MICKIYKVYNDIDDDLYIGSTTQTPSHRLSNHKLKSKTMSQSLLHVKMRLIGSEHFFIEVIEQYTYIGDKTEQFILEQDWIDILQPTLNQNRTFITDEQRLLGMKKYYEYNKEQIKEQKKQPYLCLVCNRSLRQSNKARHERSNKHNQLSSSISSL